MGIISILFLVFGWIFSVKGLIITSLCLSTVFSLFLTERDLSMVNLYDDYMNGKIK